MPTHPAALPIADPREGVNELAMRYGAIAPSFSGQAEQKQLRRAKHGRSKSKLSKLQFPSIQRCPVSAVRRPPAAVRCPQLGSQPLHHNLRLLLWPLLWQVLSLWSWPKGKHIEKQGLGLGFSAESSESAQERHDGGFHKLSRWERAPNGGPAFSHSISAIDRSIDRSINN